MSFTEFVCGGPNNYAYRALYGDGRVKVMCKLYYKGYYFERGQGALRRKCTHGKEIMRKRNGGGNVLIFTEPQDKFYRLSFFKGWRLCYSTSAPFNYK